MDPPPREIFLVLNGCMDADGDTIADDSLLRVLRLPHSVGPARARNLGAARSQGDILLFLDADVTVRPDTIRVLLGVFEGDPSLTALFGSYDDAPAEADLFSQYRNLLHHYTHMTGNEEASTFWSGCGAVRREAFLSVGGFDERYPRPCIEDVELGYRLRRAGARIRLVKELQVIHLKKWRLLRILRTDLLDRAVPWTRLILRERRFINDLNLKTPARISVALTGFVPVCLALAFRVPGLLFAAAAALLGAAALNLPLYRFFARKRGVVFALQTLPLHALYHLCCAGGFVVGLTLHLLSRGGGNTSPEEAEPLRQKVS